MNVEQQIALMELIIGRPFDNKRLAVEALNHGGLPIYLDGAFRTVERNERLALLGDKILDTALVSKWYNTRGLQGNKTHPCSIRG